MKSANIHVNSDYYVDTNAHEYQRVRILSEPTRGRVEAVAVDPLTGERLPDRVPHNYNVQAITATWESRAELWNNRNNAKLEAEQAADALDAALDAHDVPAVRVRPDSGGMVPRVHLTLEADTARRLAEILERYRPPTSTTTYPTPT